MTATRPVLIETSRGRDQFIQQGWNLFAPYAWARFVAEGRGALVINIARAKNDGASFRVPFCYLAEGSDRLGELGGWPNKEVEEMIKQYDPAKEIIFIFTEFYGGVHCRRDHQINDLILQAQ